MTIQSDNRTRKTANSSTRSQTKKDDTSMAGPTVDSAKSQRTCGWQNEHSEFNRRLIDKIGAAIAQAEIQGREEIVERLRHIHQSVQEIGGPSSGRRTTDPKTD